LPGCFLENYARFFFGAAFFFATFFAFFFAAIVVIVFSLLGCDHSNLLTLV